MCGKGSQTTTNQTSSSADPQAAQSYRDLLSRAQGVASTPYQAYTGELTAPVNAQQTAGISGINSNANFASPYIQQAAGQASASSAPLTAGQIQQYQNPYMQSVVDATQAQINHNNQVQQNQLQGNQISQGALGGNRAGVAAASLAGQQSLANNSTIAGLYNQSYQQALQAAQGQQGVGLQGANAIANYGISGQGAALSGAGAQLGAGTLQQQTQQQGDTANYGQYAQGQAYPYQQTQWLAGINTGVGSQLGGSSSGQTTGPAPNQFAQYAGAGLAAAGLFLNRGGAVHGYAGGGGVVPQHMADGGVSGTPWSQGVGWIPQQNIHAGSGAPHASAPSLQNPQSGFDPVKFAQGVVGLGNKGGGSGLGAFFNPDAYGNGNGVYGGSSSTPLAGLSAADYGAGFARGGVAGYAGGGAPAYDDLINGDPSWANPDVGSGVVPRLSFNERAEPVRRAMETGDFDPRGANSTEFKGTPSMEAANAGVVPTPMPRPADAGTPVVASDDEEGNAPPAVRGVAGGPPSGSGAGVAAFAPEGPSSYRGMPDAITRPQDKSGFGLGYLSPNAKTGLLAAGLGVLASRSPNLGNAIGEGGIAGVTAYGSANEADRKAATEAEKLSREAWKTSEDLKLRGESQGESKRSNLAKEKSSERSQAETERYHRATEDKDYAAKLITKVDPNTGETNYLTFDPKTKQLKPVDLSGGNGGDTSASAKFESTAAPVAERRKAPAASPEARDQSYMEFLQDHRPAGYGDIVKAVADYEADPNRVASLQKGERARLYRDVKLYDPTYDQTHFGEKTGVIQNFSRGPASQAVNSLNVSVAHLETLSQLGDALQNGNTPVINKIANAIATQTGRPAPSNFDAAKEIVGDEVVKAVIGGVNSQADREAIKHLILAQQTPAQLKGVIQTFTALLGGQLDGQRQRYQAGTGLNNFDEKYLAPATREALKRGVPGSSQISPEIAKMVYPSGIPQPSNGAASSAVAPMGGFAPPPGALARQFNGKTYYYDPQTKQPYPGQ